MTNKYLVKIAARADSWSGHDKVEMPSGYKNVYTGGKKIPYKMTAKEMAGLTALVVGDAAMRHPVKAGLIGAAGLGAAAYGIKKLRED
jgi:hypothetical protein